VKYEYETLRWFGLKPEELKKRLNEFGGKGFAIVYMNEAICVLGRRIAEEGDIQHGTATMVVAVPNPAGAAMS
jgi:hypothetical protein